MKNEAIINELTKAKRLASLIEEVGYHGIDKDLLLKPIRKRGIRKPQPRKIITLTNEEFKEGFTTKKNFIKLLNKIYKRYGLTDKEIEIIQCASGVKDLLDDDDYYEIFGG